MRVFLVALAVGVWAVQARFLRPKRDISFSMYSTDFDSSSGFPKGETYAERADSDRSVESGDYDNPPVVSGNFNSGPVKTTVPLPPPPSPPPPPRPTTKEWKTVLERDESRAEPPPKEEPLHKRIWAAIKMFFKPHRICR